MNEIEQILRTQNERLKLKISSSEASNIIYNLIFLKNELGNKSDNYRDSKNFIVQYIESTKTNDYGYDNLNYSKIEKLLNLLSSYEQLGFLQYALSVIARELPEHDRSWFIKMKHIIEIKSILSNHKIALYPKAFFLYTGQNLKRLVAVLVLLVFITTIILLPAFFFKFELFETTYDNYSSNFVFNHILNVLSLFADIDNNFKVRTKCWFGLCLIIIAKASFGLLIVNFIYQNISDKIASK